MFNLPLIISLMAAYLAIPFLLGYAAEKQKLPRKLLHHPLVYTFSLGGYVGVWAIFGAITLAENSGYLFLAYYFGTSALFLFAPLILQPLLSLSRTYQLSSLADLFSFRYCSQWAGTLVALGILTTVIPLMTMQISIIAETATYLTNVRTPDENAFAQNALAAAFCICVGIMALYFGSGPRSNNNRHKGLVLNTAFQSLIKLLLLLTLGGLALFAVFNTPANLEHWLHAQPEKLQMLSYSLESNNSRTLVLIFFAAALTFPHLYHLALTENPSPKALNQSSWAFPLYLLLLSLPILPILWAGQAAGLQMPAHFFALAVGKLVGNPLVSLLAFICAVAAASTCMMVIIVSVASICLNHLILPFNPSRFGLNIYDWLTRTKRILIVAITTLAFLSYLAINELPLLNGFSFAAYTAAFQFLPGILAVLYWPKGNRTGLLWGLTIGFLCWGISILLPLISHDALGMLPFLLSLFDLSHDSYWPVAAVACLGLNMLSFGVISYLTRTDEEQQYAARICSQDDLSRPIRQRLTLSSVEQFTQALSHAIGHETAHAEVDKALQALNMKTDETRPYALRLLRRQLESNLSGLLGPTVSRQIVARHLPYAQSDSQNTTEDIQLIEERLESAKSNLSGLAAELDNLRRYHRSTIENLPIGVCALGEDNEISLWNACMESLTGISQQTAVGSSIQNLPAPWNEALLNFASSPQEYHYKQQLELNGESHWFTLHKALAGDELSRKNQTLLIEEVTDIVQLEKELLHNERLASIGRLAAGVAHEIGNPITGIACLAQNLKYDSDHPAVTEAARDILTQTQRVTRIVQSLVNYSHAGAHGSNTSFETVRLVHCADDAIHLLSLNNKDAADNIINDIDPEHLAEGDTQALLQVFLNLLKNALDACDDNCTIVMKSTQSAQQIELTVCDDGPGIAENVQDQIFEPFFTTKEPGEGTGLGLALVYNIIEDHHGHIQVTSPTDTETESGTCFTIRLPRSG